MSEIIAQPLTVAIVSSTIRVEVSPALTVVEAQTLSKAIVGVNQTIVARAA